MECEEKRETGGRERGREYDREMEQSERGSVRVISTYFDPLKGVVVSGLGQKVEIGLDVLTGGVDGLLRELLQLPQAMHDELRLVGPCHNSSSIYLNKEVERCCTVKGDLLLHRVLHIRVESRKDLLFLKIVLAEMLAKVRDQSATFIFVLV